LDITSFTEFKTGQLEPIVTPAGKRDWAFIPNPLPSRVPMSEELWAEVAEAQQAVGSLEQIKGILAEPFLLLRPLQQREAIISTRLEGTYALPEQLLLFDVEQEEDRATQIRANQRNDEREVWNHYEALRQGYGWLQDGKPLDRSFILELHKVLMAGVRGEEKNPGKFRDCQVAVGRRPRLFMPPPPDRIESCVAALVEYMANGEPNGLIKSYAVHYQFEAIHPFQDGNGRVGRVLLSLCVSAWLNLSMPWLYMSEFFEKHKREYSERLFRISTNGEWAEWFDFCLQGTTEQSHASIRRCDRLRMLRDHYYDEVVGLRPRMREIIDMLFVRPVIRIAQVATQCGVTRETARLDINKLIDLKILSKLPRTRPSAFACFPIIKVVYGDDAEN
jgi:Fic family protein